jgi:hypothetical protein
MRLKHPVEAIPLELQNRLIVVLTIITAVVGGLSSLLSQGLSSVAAPNGLLSLRLVGDPIVALEILTTWDPSQRAAVESAIVADYSFIVCWAALLAIACVRAARVWRAPAAGLATAWAVWAVAALSMIANVILLAVLRSAPSPGAALPSAIALLSVVSVLARAEFIVVLTALLYLAASGYYHGLGEWVREWTAKV